METSEPRLLITYGFSNRWYFRGSISSSRSGFTGLIGASSGMTAGGLCGEKSCFTSSKVEGCDREKKWRRCVCGGGAARLTSSQSFTTWLFLTEPLCFLLMNSLISVLKRTARVRSCLRAAIRTLMALLTNIWAGVTLGHFIFLRLLWFFFFYVFTKFPLELWGHRNASFRVCYEWVLSTEEVLVLFWPFYIIERACSSHVFGSFLQVLQVPPTYQKHAD